jgi:ADP-heptose:LPS heptosyltransferase
MNSAQSTTAKQKLLVVNLWGIGDLILSSPFLRSAAKDYEVTLVGKAHARAALGDTFPDIQFIEWNAPWTVFRGKYKFWRWDWYALLNAIRQLRLLRPDAAVSVRKDPRDHLLLWLCGARRRVGFGIYGSGLFLTDPLTHPAKVRHVVEDWIALAEHLAPGAILYGRSEVHLEHGRLVTERVRDRLPQTDRPIICLHVGARIATRRWPEAYFVELVGRLRSRFDFHLILIPDPDGYGRSLAAVADQTVENLTVEELISIISAADLLIANDSAPAHIGAACKCPVIAIFGPTDPQRFRPWSKHAHVVIRDICPYRPCFDYCHFPEPICLTRLQPQEVWLEIEEQISEWVKSGALPLKLDRAKDFSLKHESTVRL